MSLVHPSAAAIVKAFQHRSARRPPQGGRAGRDPMFRRQGGAFDLRNIREYDLSDDPRRIDWRLEARSGRLYVKEYQEDERDGVVVLADLSSSLESWIPAPTEEEGSPPFAEGEGAASIAASVAWILAALGEPVLLLAFAARPLKALERGRGAIGRGELDAFFSSALGSGGAQLMEGGRRAATDIGGALRAARKRSRSKRAILVSDFLDPSWKPRQTPFARPFFIQLSSAPPAPAASRAELLVTDPESGARLRLPWDRVAEGRYRAAQAALDESLEEARLRGAFHRRLERGEDPAPLFWDLLEAIHA